MYARYAKLRDEKGLTDYAVAKKTGISPSLISEWKQRSETNANASLTFESMMKIADLLGIDASEFRKEE